MGKTELAEAKIQVAEEKLLTFKDNSDLSKIRDMIWPNASDKICHRERNVAISPFL